ncbi:hypothetical protein BD769DRAFT_1395909 [Suillus cothurnatus]|nr:hypothetical protein BD769DRAFT_1395909 [Suillus cothurnatus]
MQDNAALFWKAQGSPPKFNFTGNQFSEVYIFHVQFLEDLKKNAPQKFHKLMADIFAAIEALTHTTINTGTDSKTNALAFLDLDGMDESKLAQEVFPDVWGAICVDPRVLAPPARHAYDRSIFS